MWAEIVRKIYGNGMPADLRKKVWSVLYSLNHCCYHSLIL